MGIREEVEKLRSPYKNPHFNKIHDKPLNDVLSILDEHLGELVEEVEIQPNELKLLSYGDWFLRLMKTCKPGDRIAIYRKEPSV